MQDIENKKMQADHEVETGIFFQFDSERQS